MATGILLVCTGNICRSPMAEALFSNKVLARYPHLFPFVDISSAGTSAVEGGPATQAAVQVMDLWGVDLDYHQAEQLTLRALAEADLIVVMSREHLLSVERMDPQALSRAFTLNYLAAQKDRVLEVVGGSVPIGELELAQRAQRVLEALSAERGDARLSGKRSREPEFESRAFDIMDPMGGNLEVYLMVAEEIDNALDALMEMLFGDEEEE
jgi:protein-tyrosine-phosphatase